MAEQKEKRGRKIVLAVRIAFVAGGLIWGWYKGWFSKDTFEAFGQIKAELFLLAFLFYVVGQFSVAFRWRLLLRTQGVKISVWMAVKLTFLGLFYNNFLPSSVGGDLVRAWYVTKHTEKRFEAALSVFVDRAVGLVGALLIAVVFYFLLPRPEGIKVSISAKGWLDGISRHRGLLVWTCLIVGAVFVLFMMIPKVRRKLGKLWSYSVMAIGRIEGRIKKAVTLYCRNPIDLAIVLGLTLGAQLLTITGFWLVGREIGAQANISYYYVFFALSWVVGMVPISIGGVVLVEGPLEYMFVHFASVGKEAARVLALLQRIIWILASLPGAAIHIFGAHLPKQIAVDYGESMD